MRAAVPELTASQLSVQQVDVGRLQAGPISVGKLVVDDAHVTVSTGAAAFTGLEVAVDLDMSLDWTVKVDVPVVGSWSWHGTIAIGKHSCTVPLPDVSLPGLESFTVDLGPGGRAALTIDDLSTTVGPLQDLKLGTLKAEGITGSQVLAPVAGFSINGFGIGHLNVAGLGVPAVSAETITIKHVTGQGFPLGDVSLAGLALPEADATDISSQGIDADGMSNPFVFTSDVGVLDITLKIAPGARLHADELRLSGVRSSTSVGAIELHDVVLPYEIFDLTLSQIGIDTVELPKIEVG
jgi:hypothetical protein